MHTTDLLHMMVHKTDLTPRQAEAALHALVDTIKKALSTGTP